jgi:hypothetical protein
MDPTRWASPDAPVDMSRAAVCQPAVGTDDEDEAPAGDPEYADLLDGEWLERVADARERDDDLVDVGLTLDLDAYDDEGEQAQVMDLDVGVLLTSLPSVAREGRGSVDGAVSDGAVSDGAEPELGDGSLSVGALRDVLLPEGRALRERVEDDDEIGDDEHFPAFELSPVLRPAEDDSSEGEA